MMSTYLTYLNSKSFAASGSAPDENYAREIMQLFSIGLYKLNLDGTKQPVDPTKLNGDMKQTYDSDDIVSMARHWTGFTNQAFRANLEARSGADSANFVDPMKINAASRDVLPKRDLHDGFIGDNYPLCTELPSLPFLSKGASYRYLGESNDKAKGMMEPGWADAARDDIARLVLNNTASSLFNALCGAAAIGSKCTFPTDVVISAANLPCHGVECKVDTVRTIKLVDLSASGNGATAWFEYIRRPCVDLAFYKDAKLIQRFSGDYQMCGNPQSRYTAGATCCTAERQDKGKEWCEYHVERVTFATAEQRCATWPEADDPRWKYPLMCSKVLSSLNAASPPYNFNPSGGNNTNKFCGTNGIYSWLNMSCSVKAQIDDLGMINIVHTPESKAPVFRLGSKNQFSVTWQKSDYPKPSNNCKNGAGAAIQGCIKSGATCLCDVEVETGPSITSIDASDFNSAKVETYCKIGAVDPSAFKSGTYKKCNTAACKKDSNLQVWYRKDTATKTYALDMHTVFKVVKSIQTRGGTLWLLNRVSTSTIGVVRVGGIALGGYKFRTPPHFMAFENQLAADTRDAEYETEAVLDHLFFHDNTAPFVAYRMIQRMTTSNPSPRYIKAVATAFATGKTPYKTYSGKYGDMAATVAMVLMDREASSAVLDADPNHGLLREPLLKVLHLMRSMELDLTQGFQLFMPDLMNEIGMQKSKQPTVFNFYLPEYQPVGPVRERGLAAPEAQIMSAPLTIGYLNGISSLTTYGLTSCGGGFGSNYRYTSCNVKYDVKANFDPPYGPKSRSDGALAYVPNAAADKTAATIDELSTLLTAGRLSEHAKAVIGAAYDAKKAEDAAKVPGTEIGTALGLAQVRRGREREGERDR